MIFYAANSLMIEKEKDCHILKFPMFRTQRNVAYLKDWMINPNNKIIILYTDNTSA
jgi:hypothetical protein